ncbi:MAG: hypothetical protein QME41_03210, partial [Actinomycetota bacterium]|nr:hypothetical protein [Actinomycetota bacterium]
MGIIFLLLLFSSMTNAYASEETLTASNLPPANASFLQGSSNVIGDILYLYAPAGDGITVADITVNQIGTASDSDISLLKLIRDIDSNGVYNVGIDEILASTTTAGGIASFAGINLAISPDTTETILVAFDISASATPGVIIQSNLVYASGDIVVAALDSIADYGNLLGAELTVISADTLSVTQVSLADTSTAQGALNMPLSRLSLAASAGDGVRVTSLRVDELGSSTDADVSSVRLVHDSNKNSLFEPGVDVTLGSGVFSGGAVTFAIDFAIAASASETLFVVADISPTALVGASLQANIAGAASLAVASPDTVAPFGSLAGRVVTVTDKPDTVNISQSAATTATVARASADNLIQVLDASMAEDEATITALSIRRTGTGADSDISAGGVKLFLDVDGSGSLNAPDTQLGASESFSAGVAAFNGFNLPVSAAGAKKLLVTYSVSATATVGASLGSEIALAGDVVVSAPDSAALSATPLGSALRVVADSADTLSVTQVSLADTSTAQGALNMPLSRLSLAASAGDGVRVTSLRVDELGSSTDADVSSVRLVHDSNKNSLFEPGVDVTLGSGVFSGGAVTFAIDFAIAASASETLFVVADISPTALVGASLQANIAGAASLAVASPDTVAPFGSLAGRVVTVTDKPDTVNISQSAATTATVARASADNLIQVLDASMAEDEATITALSIRRTGTGADSDISAGGVKLFLDVDGSGSLNAPDTQLGASESFSAGVAAFNGFNLPVSAAGAKKLLVTYSVSATATVGASLGSEIALAGDVVVSAADSAALSGALVSNLRTIASSNDTLTVTHAPPASASRQQGTVDNVLDVVRLAAGIGDGITVTDFNVKQTGTALGSDIQLVKLARDINANGIIDTGEVIASTTTASGVAAFGGLNFTVAPETTETILVGVDLSSLAKVGATVTGSVSFNGGESLSDIKVASPDTVADFGTLDGATLTVDDKPDTLAIGQSLVATGTVARFSDDNVIQKITLSIGAFDDSATLTSLTVNRIGTAADSDTKANGVKLWLDANANGALDAADSILSAKSFVAGTADFGGLSVDILNSQTTNLLATYSIASTATVDATIGSRVSAATVAAPDTVAPIGIVDSSLQTITLSADTLTVTNVPPAASGAAQESTPSVSDVIQLHAGLGDGVTINGFTVRNLGSATDSDILSVKLIDDLNDNGAYDVGEPTIASTSTASGMSIFDGLNIFVQPDTTETVLLAFEISKTATVGATIRSDLAYNANMTLSGLRVASPDTVAAFGNLTGATITITDKPDALNVSQTLVESGLLKRASDDNLIQVLDFTTDDRAAIDSITIVTTGTATDADIKSGGVKLFLDVDGSNSLSAPDTQLSTSKTLAGGTVTFDNIGHEVSFVSPKKLLVTYSVASGAALGATLGAKVQSVTVAAPDSAALGGALVSNLRTIASSNDTLTVTHAPPASASRQQGTVDNVLDVVRLAAGIGDGITVTDFNVKQTGTALGSDIQLVKLARDINANGIIDTGEVIASTTTASGVAAFGGLNFTVAPETTETILVGVDLSSLAKVGATVTGSVSFNGGESLSDIKVASPDTVADFGTLDGATLTVDDKPDTLAIGQSLVAPHDVIVGKNDQLMQVLDLSVAEDRVRLSTLDVLRIGTATDSDTASNGIKLWYDADNNGSVSANDWQLSTSKTFVGGRTTFNNIKLAEITPANPAKLLVTYDIAADAMIDRTIGASIESSASVMVTIPDMVSLTSEPLTGSLNTIAPTPPTPPTGLQVAAGLNNVYSLNWKNNPASENVTSYNIYRST